MRIAATCRPANDGYLRQIGAEHTIDYTQGCIAETLKRYGLEPSRLGVAAGAA